MMTTDDLTRLAQDLDTGVAQMGLELAQADAERLLALIRLLTKWNRAYNLTAIDKPNEVLAKHIMDSLSLQPFLSGSRVLDVGTGGGFPGLPLAIVNPQREFVLLDSHAKKLRFIEQAAADLDLENVSTVHARVEAYAPKKLFDTITSRAFASLRQFADWTSPLLAPGGRLLAMKGHLDAAELEALGAGWQIATHAVVVPFVDAARHIVVLRRA